MPDGGVLRRTRTESIAALSSYIEELPGTRELQTLEVRAYPTRNFIFGWSIPIVFSDSVCEFRVLVPPGFPFTALRIALAHPPPFLSWPHVEKDGVLCLLQKNSTLSARDPVSVLQNLLSWAVKLVEDSQTGSNAIDFETEFNTYWHYKVDENVNEIRSLLALDPANRVVRFWKGKQFHLIAEDESLIKEWLARRYAKPESTYSSYRTGPAGLLWLSRALRPEEYPVTARDLQKIATAASAMGTIADIADEAADDIKIILAAPTVNGPVLAGVSVPNPKNKDIRGRSTDPLRRGFRPGRVPRTLLADRFLASSARVTRFGVTRIDHDWIHGRGRDNRQANLKGASVAILGCGSIGSAVAVSLAKSGIGRLSLIDNESLAWTNTSRHSLGAASVGLNKAIALAQELQVNYPHLRIVGRAMSVGEMLVIAPELLSSCELVISMTADWGMDQALAVWSRNAAKQPSVIYGWTEAHACAGHAVLTGETCCIECGRDPTGVPQFTITEWPEDQNLQEPACDAAFQPYGAVEAAHTVTLIAGLALDALLTGTRTPKHRFWVGSKSLLVTSGGHWSSQWEGHAEFRDIGNLIVEQPWPPHIRCVNCEANP